MNSGEDETIHLRLGVSTFMPTKPSEPAESIVELSWRKLTMRNRIKNAHAEPNQKSREEPS